jgi:type VI secretion system secreted protein Hcp
MAIDMFLTLAGIKGESSDKEFLGATELSSVNWGLNLPETSTGKFGPAELDELVVSKVVDTSSPRLMKALNDATPFTSGRISFRKAGATDSTTSLVYFVIDLVDVVVRRVVAQSSAVEEVPREQVTLGFREATWAYRRKNADGSYTVVSSFTWAPVPVA